MRTLYLVRHGHTIWNDTGGVAGRTDIALSDVGRDAARRLGASFSGEFEVNEWFCSPLQRTRETSTILRTQLKRCTSSKTFPGVQLDDRLLELNFGDWEGMSWSEVHERYEDQMNQWGQDWVNRSPPNGETFAQQVLRCRDWMEGWIAKDGVDVAAESSLPQSALVVTHGGSIRALLCHALGWQLDQAMGFRVDPASLCVLQQDDHSGPWYVRMINSPHA